MNGYLVTMIVLIVLIGCVTNVLTERYKTMRKTGSLTDDTIRRALEQERGEAQREIAELRERVKVLERIVTDGNTLGHQDTRRIAAEIEALRDERDA